MFGYPSKVSQQINSLIQNEEYSALLTLANQYLVIDPNNSEWLYIKFRALSKLEQLQDNLGFLRKLCWYRSSCDDVFYHLACNFAQRGDVYDALLATAFCLSINDTNKKASALQSSLLKASGKTALKVSFLKSDRIGHLTSEPDAWLREQAVSGSKNDSVLHLFVAGEPVCNDALLVVLERYVNVHRSSFFHKLHMTRGKLIAEQYFVKMPYDANYNARKKVNADEKILELCRVYNAHERVIYLTENEKQQALEEALCLGIDLSEKLVLLHIRDSAYLSHLLPEKDFSYHRMRDGSIIHYEKAIRYLVSLGYRVLRVGGETNQRLDTKISGYTDLCGKTSPLLDLALYDFCQFYIGTNSGPLGTSAMFDVPTLLVNCAPAVNFYATKGRCIAKTLWQNGESVCFNEIIAGKTLGDDSDVRIRDCYDANELAKYGLVYKENTEEEIVEAVTEFEQLHRNQQWSVYGENQQRYLAETPSEVGAFEGKTIPTESYLQRYYR
ncbi:hypothetical protein KUL42_07870 [Alteromonas sp. KUL42]|uniref:TIGR04372 family glycosyltransferase n=1 Tax=Alteromonas sp. KUL42 TaxID=2480797 RepID=UPI001035B8A9|nr:TIGR04372 family glycosyltransferase [Alteromonas sp. KUL42]TAP37595.1 TIGR04372 family glycosyltransferase [Alteromonas sp. KUL42]GEA06026.1 hypothetical protein KUL42_07870 [Alteromonas sp. KUL42]